MRVLKDADWIPTKKVHTFFLRELFSQILFLIWTPYPFCLSPAYNFALLLERKSEEEAKQKRVIKGLGKISQNKSEKQPSAPASQEAVPGQPSEKKERAHTNNGAKRKQHLEVEVVEENVDPEDPRFNKDLARLYKTRDVIRYELIPMRFIKKVYHVRTYTQNDEYFSGKAPDAPFLNSQYDGSFIAGMAQLRYMYAMPVERIVKLFNDNGFDMDKGTAHGLLRKTERLFENLYHVLGDAIKEDTYIAGDETYHRVLVDTKNKNGKGIKKAYVWVVTAVNTGLVYYFYHDGSSGENGAFPPTRDGCIHSLSMRERG